MIWNETMECMDREQLREIQSSRLKKMAEYVYPEQPTEKDGGVCIS